MNKHVRFSSPSSPSTPAPSGTELVSEVLTDSAASCPTDDSDGGSNDTASPDHDGNQDSPGDQTQNKRVMKETESEMTGTNQRPAKRIHLEPKTAPKKVFKDGSWYYPRPKLLN